MLGTLAVVMLVQGWSVAVLWGWFVAPRIEFPLHTVEAIGIMVLFTMLKGYTPSKEEETTEKVVGRGLMSAFHALFVLGIGWIVHLFL